MKKGAIAMTRASSTALDDDPAEVLENLQGRRDNSMMVTETALGQHWSRAWLPRDTKASFVGHRVIGIRCQGFDETGIITTGER